MTAVSNTPLQCTSCIESIYSFVVKHLCVCAISVTPEDYQPPGFKEGDSDSIEFEKEPVRLTMGEVATPFHTLKMDVTTERGRLEQVKVEAI